MKATFNRKVLQQAFSLASQASPSSTPKDILKNVLLVATGPDAYLSATDQEVSIRVKVPECQSSNGGKALLPAGRFKQLLSTVESEGLDLSVSGSKCSVKAGRTTLDLATPDPDSFPEIAEFKETEYRVISGHSLKAAIAKTVYATDPSSTRYCLNGVLFDFRDDTTCLVATDGKRLAIVELAASDSESNSTGMNGVVPATACRLIERCIEGDEDVFVALTGNNIHVQCGNATISARLVEGRFPAYEQVIPVGNDKTTTVPCGELLSAINQASLVASADNKRITLSFDDGNLTLTSEGQDVGRSEVVVPISWEHSALAIDFDGKLLVDYLKSLSPTDLVEILLNDGDSAGLFFAGDGYRYVAMPLANN